MYISVGGGTLETVCRGKWIILGMSITNVHQLMSMKCFIYNSLVTTKNKNHIVQIFQGQQDPYTKYRSKVCGLDLLWVVTRL